MSSSLSLFSSDDEELLIFKRPNRPSTNISQYIALIICILSLTTLFPIVLFYHLVQRFFIFVLFSMEYLLWSAASGLILFNGYRRVGGGIGVGFCVLVIGVLKVGLVGVFHGYVVAPQSFFWGPDGFVEMDNAWIFYSLFVYIYVVSMIAFIALVVCLICLCTKRIRFRFNFYRLYQIFMVGVYLSSIVIFILSVISISVIFIGSSCEGDTCNSDCDPINPGRCLLPFPSTFHLKEDQSTQTGYRVNFSPKSAPILHDGDKINFSKWNELDGFSTIAPLLFSFRDVSPDNAFIRSTYIGSYLLENVTTVIINTETGERHAHWTELDVIDTTDETVVMQAAVPMKHNTRYVVGVRGLVKVDGTPVDTSPDFEVLKDINNSDDRSLYYQKEIFPILEKEGFQISEIQIAWDFVTISKDCSLGRSVKLREMASDYVDEHGIQYKILKEESGECDSTEIVIGKSIWGYYETPTFQKNGRGSYLTGDPYGNDIEITGTTKIPFVLRIPCSLLSDPTETPFVLEFGHGLFATRGVSGSRSVTSLSNLNKWIILSTDWYGMSTPDLLMFANILVATPEQFSRIPDTIIQGYVNKFVSHKLVRDYLSSDKFLSNEGIQYFSKNTQFNYWGVSQGSILGGGYVSFSPTIKKALLSVPGTPFSLVLSRSADFELYHMLMNLEFYKWSDIRLLFSLMQMLWDPAESAGWLESMNQDPYHNFPKQVLLHDAPGDPEVSVFGARIMARSYQCSTVAPQNWNIYGVPEKEGTFNGSAIVEWKYNSLPDDDYLPDTNLPSDPNYNVHGCPANEPINWFQASEFFTDGTISNYCEGKCIADIC